MPRFYKLLCFGFYKSYPYRPDNPFGQASKMLLGSHALNGLTACFAIHEVRHVSVGAVLVMAVALALWVWLVVEPRAEGFIVELEREGAATAERAKRMAFWYAVISLIALVATPILVNLGRPLRP